MGSYFIFMKKRPPEKEVIYVYACPGTKAVLRKEAYDKERTISDIVMQALIEYYARKKIRIP